MENTYDLMDNDSMAMMTDIGSNPVEDELKDIEALSILVDEHGHKAYVLGTAHFSVQSNNDVRRVMNSLKPDIVLLELCEARRRILSVTEDEWRKDSKMTFYRMRQIIKSRGFGQGLLEITFHAMSAKIASKLNVVPGGEFRVAFTEASKFPHCKVVLIDRPLEITLNRALNALNFFQKIRLLFDCMLGRISITEETVERCKKKDFLDSIINEISEEYPALSKVLIEERDIILSKAIRKALKPIQIEADPRGFIYPVVCCIVGIGHVEGIRKYWDMEIDVEPLMKVQEKKKRDWRSFTIISCVTICALIAYKVYKQK